MDTCGGCQYHEFPYKATPPILIDGKRDIREFTCKEDVYDIIDMLIKEVNENNAKGKEFDVAKSINAQLPFFTCRNHLYDKEIQRDVQRYIYCKEFGIAPYPGNYGEQPYEWVNRFYNIKNAFAKRESTQIEKIKNKKD